MRAEFRFLLAQGDTGGLRPIGAARSGDAPGAALDRDKLIACLWDGYLIRAAALRFIPPGQDPGAFTFEALTSNGGSWFVKVRSAPFRPACLLVPRMLVKHGIETVVALIPQTSGELWCAMDPYTVKFYPFVRGESAMVRGLTAEQWRQFGTTLKAVHTGPFAELLEGQ